MPLWGNVDLANNKPKFLGINTPGSNWARYSNANVFSANAAAVANVARGTHPGWVLKRPGTGGVIAINFSNIGNPGTWTTDNVTATINSDGAGTGANVKVRVNTAAGQLANATVDNPGSGYQNVAAMSVTLSGGGGATGNGNCTIVLGGRAGRVQYETLVAMNSILASGNAQNTVIVTR